MKIGLILANPPGYSETFFNSKINGLQENGANVTVFAQTSNEEFKLCPVKTAPKVYANPIKQLIAMGVVYLALLPQLRRILRYIALERQEKTAWRLVFKRIYLNAHLLKADADWLHFGFATQALGSETVAKAIGAKMAVSFRGFDINAYPIKYPGCYDALWNQVDKVHSISDDLLHKAHALGLDKTTPNRIITPAVNLKSLSEISNKKSKNKVLQIVTIARLHWVKGIDLLIETAGLLKQKDVEFNWTVVGDGDQKSSERYRYHIYEKGLQNEVTLKGQQSHSSTLQQLSDADVYVQTSLNEGFCNAVLEAQALGKLCIATDVGGLPENIKDATTGWLVPKNNAGKLADKIVEVVSLSDAEKVKISTAARSRVAEEFTVEKQQQQFVKFYSEA